jgi:hypothetical protein
MKATVLYAAALSSLAAMVAAQAPAGGEFRVNTYTSGSQRLVGRPAMEADGDFVVVWESVGQDGSAIGVFGQRFAASGARRGNEFAVNTYTTGLQYRPSVTAGRRGDFVVVWVNSPQTVPASTVEGRLYDSAGAAVGGEFVVNTSTTGFVSEPQVAQTSHGRFVVTWTSPFSISTGLDIAARRFDSAANPIGDEFTVNSYTTERQRSPDVTMAADGAFAITWTEYRPSTLRAVRGQRFDPSGNAVGVDFQVNTSPGPADFAAISGSPAGGFVVSWERDDGFQGGMAARRFDAFGNAVGSDFAVNTSTIGHQHALHGHVARDDAGNFVVVWQGPGAGSAYDIFGQRFAASGALRGAEFRVNSFTTDYQRLPSVASDAVGNFVVGWRSEDGNLEGVFARRFGGLGPVALAVDTTNNRVLEPGETVDVRPSWRNVNGAAQTFAGALSDLAGPAGATYTITDAGGDYGTVPDGAMAVCADCYAVSVSNPPTRPAVHWDASAVESIVPDVQGQQKQWLLHVGGSFTDVPPTSAFYRFIETLLHHGITGGCSATAYCPLEGTTRQQMAVFALVAREGAGYVPPACGATPTFADVPASSPYCRWVEELARRRVVSGCGNGNYCPTSSVTREQMAVFVLRTLDSAFTPLACSAPMFADVPASSPFCRWIEELARRGVVTGCGGGNYCPIAAVTREQMGVFLSVTFGLALYGP